MTQETFISGDCEPIDGSPRGVELRTFVSQLCGSTGFSTGTATFRGKAELASHIHDYSEAITVLSGCAVVVVEQRAYRLSRLDCMHIPAGVPHAVRNSDEAGVMVAHWSFASASPARTFVASRTGFEDRGEGLPSPEEPEHLNRFTSATVYELAPGAYFRDLFAKRFGAVGICGGYGRFTKGSSLPCHTHAYDESITILSGSAICQVQGSRYEMASIQTAFVPQGKPHRFLNSGETKMEMLWVYAGDEPDRVIVDNQYCDGMLAWPGTA